MNHKALITLTLVAAATLAACGGMPKGNVQLDQARNEYRTLRADPRSEANPGGEVKLATDAMSRANAAWNDSEPEARINHLSYLASQRVAIARATIDTKAAEAMVAGAAAERTQVQLAARTQEVSTAQRNTEAARQTAQMAQADAATAERNAAAAASTAAEAERSAAAARSASSQAQAQTMAALEANRLLEERLKALNAKPTPRGLVITLGDVLFDVNRAQLQPGGLRLVDQLVAVLKEFPQRNALIEGHTDSTGSDAHNLALSTQRADAVRNALMQQGIAGTRVSSRGYGESTPVSDNNSAAGRQMNRRVEIVLSDENGKLSAR
jgi:outer membrane protein OmpA-like peptidoglycan-associated protein